MKTIILVEEKRTQLCLKPENEHDKSVLDVLEKLPNTHRTNLYARQGGYTAFEEYGTAFGQHGQHKDLLIVFDKPAQQDTLLPSGGEG